MFNKLKYIFPLVMVFAFTSCEKAFFEEDLASTNPKENFEYLWKECDEKYSYFDLKDVDWSAVKTAYEAKIYEGMTEDSLFQVLGDMLNELKDGHVNLKSNFDRSFYRIPHLGQDNFDWRIIQDNYLPEDYYVSGPFQHAFIDNGNIGYIRFASFSGEINNDQWEFMLERYKDTKGLVLDLRENGGGAVSDLFAILSRFIDEETTIFYSRLKNGPGHNDFSEAEASILQPNEGTRYNKKVAVLTDRGTYSSGSYTSLSTKAISTMVMIGDTTGGGLGLPNGGQLPNGWTYRFSISQALTIDDKSPDYENGVPPDYTVLFDWNDLTKDEILEYAIDYLNQ